METTEQVIKMSAGILHIQEGALDIYQLWIAPPDDWPVMNNGFQLGGPYPTEFAVYNVEDFKTGNSFVKVK